jgi:pimeloyl-ACP methyl ester carboxylesterase
MKVIQRSFAAVCLLCIFCIPLAAQTRRPQRTRVRAQSQTQTKLVDVEGHKLSLKVAGAGTPTVVLEYGLGGNAADWDNIFPEVARFTRVVAYERAGYGKSEAGPEPRSQTQLAKELHTLLHNAGITPPYVLVGHSLGGANIRAFAYLFKEEIAGLVFVDPFNERVFSSQTKKQLDEALAQQDAALKGAPTGALDEWKSISSEVRNDFPELRAFGSPPDVPTMIIVAGRDRPPRWMTSAIEQFTLWVTSAHEAGMVVSTDNPHNVMNADPLLVISSIRRVVFPSVQNVLEREIKDTGVNAAIARYRQMRMRYPLEYFRERTLNTLGYQQLSARHIQEAIALFKLNVEMYPRGFNTYDSLGEAYMAHGDRLLAIRNYRKSLALNPQNTGAVAKLKQLESTH